MSSVPSLAQFVAALGTSMHTGDLGDAHTRATLAVARFTIDARADQIDSTHPRFLVGDIASITEALAAASTRSEFDSAASSRYVYSPLVALVNRGRNAVVTDVTGGVVRGDVWIDTAAGALTDMNTEGQRRGADALAAILMGGAAPTVNLSDAERTRLLRFIALARDKSHARRGESQETHDSTLLPDWTTTVRALVGNDGLLSNGAAGRCAAKDAVGALDALLPKLSLQFAGIRPENAAQAWQVAHQMLPIDERVHCGLRAIAHWLPSWDTPARNPSPSVVRFLARDATLAYDCIAASPVALERVWTAATRYLAVCGIGYDSNPGDEPCMFLLPRPPPDDTEYMAQILHDRDVCENVLHTVAVLQRVTDPRSAPASGARRASTPLFDLGVFMFQQFVNSAYAAMVAFLLKAPVLREGENMPALSLEHAALPWAFDFTGVLSWSAATNAQAGTPVVPRLVSDMLRLTEWVDGVRRLMTVRGGAYDTEWWAGPTDEIKDKLKPGDHGRCYLRNTKGAEHVRVAPDDKDSSADLCAAYVAAWDRAQVPRLTPEFANPRGGVLHAAHNRAHYIITEAHTQIQQVVQCKQCYGIHGLRYGTHHDPTLPCATRHFTPLAAYMQTWTASIND